MTTALNQNVPLDTLADETEEKSFNPDWKPDEAKPDDDAGKTDEGAGNDAGKGADDEAARLAAEDEAARAAAEAGGKAPPGFVPHGALHEERQRRKELEAEIGKMNERFGQVLESVSKIGKPEPKEDTVAAPAFEDDPVGALKAQNDRLERELGELKSERAKEREHGTQAERANEFANTVAKQVNTFRKNTPDYDQAFDFVMQRRLKDLMTLGNTEEEAHQVLNLEAGYIAERSMKAGKNPGETLYAMAKEWGYKPVKTDKTDKTDDDTMRTVERGMQRSTPSGGGTPSLRELASLEDDEFDQALKELGMK